MASRKKSRRELAQNLLDISMSAKEAATGLLEQGSDSGSPSGPLEVSQRAASLRKRVFSSSGTSSSISRKSSRQAPSDSSGKVMISICKMKKNSKGNYHRDGTFTEVALERMYTYDEVIRAANTFFKGFNGSTLYRPRGGVIILREDLNINGKSVSWTLGSYMRMRKVGPDSIQLGIGPSQKVCYEISSFDLEVKYGKVTNDSLSLKGASRDLLRPKLNVEKIPFQPEEYGYYVVYIAEDGVPLYPVCDRNVLNPGECLIAKDYQDESDLSIVYQSPERITCNSGKEEVALYCVVNVLSQETTYDWHTPTTSKMPSTPVIYVTKPGIYFCTVRYKDEEVVSQPSEILVTPGSGSQIDNNEADIGGWECGSHHSATSQHGSTSLEVSRSSILSDVGPSKTGATSAAGLSGMTFPLSELIKATDQKKYILGKGGYGTVYKGNLRHTIVAIKFLNEEGQSSLGGQSVGAAMLETELAALTKFRHPNIVSIMGYSTDHDVIVYEYAQGGSLYKRLHEVPGSAQLQWNDRFHILRGTCCGLVYLHTAEHPIVHQDIKSQNILVDAHGNAKITDFGFALELPKVLDGRSMYTAKAFARSEGYYPGELTSGKYSPKSDVFSLGVVMLETYTGQKAFSPERSDPKLVDHLEDDLKTLASFKSCQDQHLDVCKEEWAEFLLNLVVEMLARHSKRLTSVQVMQAWEAKSPK